MTKTQIQYISFFVLGLILLFLGHQYILEIKEVKLPFSLTQVYVFHGLVSLLLCVVLSSFVKTEKFKEQVGFMYLGSVLVKAVLFCVVFRKAIFTDQLLTNVEAASLLLPLFIGLFFEVFFLSKLLKQKTKIKNE